MSAFQPRKTSPHFCGSKDGFVKVRRKDLDRLMTEVMQLRDFLPRVLGGELTETLRRASAAQPVTEQLGRDKERLRRDCEHLRARLDAERSQCQREREEKLLLREQLWQSGAELQQQADFCAGLGSAACGLLWSCSPREDAVALWLADGKLPAFLAIAAQTLESFVRSLGEDARARTEDHKSHENQFALALAGTITNIAAVTCGRDFLARSGHVLLDTLLKLLELMEAGVFPKLKVLMLMALYNVSINTSGLKYIIENRCLLPVIQTLLAESDWEVCLHSLRLLQSLLLEEAAALPLGPSLADPELLARVGRLAVSNQRPGLREAARQTLEDLRALEEGRACKQSRS